MTHADGVWVWSYNMNGYGVRDDYRFGQSAPVSQRVFDAGSGQWHVWYFLGQSFYYAGEWIGGAVGEQLVFEQADATVGDQPATSRLEFSNITTSGFDWRSVNLLHTGDETFVDWEIRCRKRL